MHFCLLCGYGANAINPYLAFEAIQKLHADGDLPQDVGVDQLTDQYITAVEEGHSRRRSRRWAFRRCAATMPPSSSRPSGLSRAVIDKYFTGTASRIEGCGLDVIAREALAAPSRGLRAAAARLAGTRFRRRVSIPARRRKAPLEPRHGHQAAARGDAERSEDCTPSTPRRSTTRAAT